MLQFTPGAERVDRRSRDPQRRSNLTNGQKHRPVLHRPEWTPYPSCFMQQGCSKTPDIACDGLGRMDFTGATTPNVSERL